MALDASHPNIVEYHGALGAVTVPKLEARAAIAARAEWEVAHARRERNSTRPLVIGGCVGAALAILLGLLVWRLDGIEKYTLVVPAGFVIGAILGHLVGGVIRGANPAPLPYVNFPPVHGIAPEVLAHAPADAPVGDILRWTHTIAVYRNTRESLPRVRQSVARKDYENPISPGDRSTWYYDPAGLAKLEGDLASQRAAYELAAAELGFVPDPE